MKTLKPLTLLEIIEFLDKTIGPMRIRGLSGNVYSYAGFPYRNATDPTDYEGYGFEIADWYRETLGKLIAGIDGNDYEVMGNEFVYYSEDGEHGPVICGFEQIQDGLWEPILFMPRIPAVK